MKLWGLEPAMIIGAIAAILAGLVAFGVNVTTEQQEAIKNVAATLIPLLAAVFIRQQVTPTAKLEAAYGHDAVEEVAKVTKAEIGTTSSSTHPVQRQNYRDSSKHIGGTGMFLLVASLALAGCGVKQQQVALQVDRTVHAGLSGVQDVVDNLCDQKVMQPADCVVFNQQLIPALEAGQAFNRAVAAERGGQLGDIVVAIGRLTETVTQLVPEKYRPDLLTRLQEILNGAFQESKQ
jgi:hypothetical protein